MLKGKFSTPYVETRGAKAGKLFIKFTAENGSEFLIPIESLVREDGSGNNYLLNYKSENFISGFFNCKDSDNIFGFIND